MPFTFAHPAAVVPLYRPLRRYTVLSALVLGSLTPDLWYFLPLGVNRVESHSAGALLWFCLPVGMAVYLLFHLLLKRPLLSLVPEWAAARLAPCAPASPLLPPGGGLAVVFSLALGAATHLVWDAFTHGGGAVVRAFPVLRTQLLSIGQYDLYIFTVLQHGSTLAGLALLTWWSWRRLRDTPPQPLALPVSFTDAQRLRIAALLLAVAAAAALWSGLYGPLPSIAGSAPQIFLRRAVPPGMAAFGLALLAYCAMWQLYAWRGPRSST